jgi:hypothetical protein
MNTDSRDHVGRIVIAILATCVIVTSGRSADSRAANSGAAHASMDSLAEGPEHAAADSVPTAYRIQPEQLGRLLAGPAAGRPKLLHVGFRVLYRSGHITGSRYVGPASKPEGLDSLKAVLRPLRRQDPLVLYCGCCPWKHCPNVLPAFRVARAMGFERVQVLFIADSFQRDWIDKGLPFGERE